VQVLDKRSLYVSVTLANSITCLQYDTIGIDLRVLENGLLSD